MSPRRSRSEPARVTVRLTGALDASTGNRALHKLLRAAMPWTILVVDVAGVSHIDDAGVAILETVRRQTRMMGGDLVLSGADRSLDAVLGDSLCSGARQVTSAE